jgi:hypothetical protein
MSTPSRRWPRVRFRLWHLLALVTLLCGWLGYETNRARKISAVTTAIQSKRGTVLYRHRFNEQPWRNESDAALSNRIPNCVRIYLRVELPAPKWVIDWLGPYYFVRPTDIAVGRHGSCNELLPAICSLRSLEALTIHCAGSENLELLKNLPHLKELHLSGQFGDGCVPLLSSLRSLETLSIVDANIPKEEARQLRQRLPKCRVFIGIRAGRIHLDLAEYQLGAPFE